MRAVIAIVVLAACHHGASPPPAPTCEQAADHVQALLPPDGARAVRDVFASRCREDAWAAEVRICVVSTTSLKDPKHCKAKLPPVVRAHLETDLAALGAKAKGRVPEACREYAQAVDRLMACDKFPQAARDAIRQSFETQRQAWNSGSADVEGCRPAAVAIRQAAASVGCSML